MELFDERKFVWRVDDGGAGGVCDGGIGPGRDVYHGSESEGKESMSVEIMLQRTL